MTGDSMKIEVEISQFRCKGKEHVPVLIGLIITKPTGDKGSSPSMKPEIAIFVDLTADRARELAQSLIKHAEMIEP